MKKLLALVAVFGMIFADSPVFAQESACEENGCAVHVETTDAAYECAVEKNTTTGNVVPDDVQLPAEEAVQSSDDAADKSTMEKLVGFCLEHLNYGTVTLFMAIESSFIPFPSEAVVPPAAWKAATSGDMNIVLVVIFATLGAVIGALINYYLALWLGRPLIYRFARSRFGRMCLLDEEKVKHAEEYFEKHGAVSTFVGRLVPAVRQLISIPAGLVRMKMKRFLLFTALGAGAWNIILAILGYYMKYVPGMDSEEAVMAAVKEHSGTIGMVFVALIVLVLGIIIYKAMKKKK